jgi:hypothetical protein
MFIFKKLKVCHFSIVGIFSVCRQLNREVTIPESGVVPRVPHESLLQKPARPSHHSPAAPHVSPPKPLVQYSKPSAAAIAAKAIARGPAGKAKPAKVHSALYSVLSEKLLLTGQR